MSNLKKTLFKAALVLCLSLGVASSSWAAQPFDALSAKPEKSAYAVLNLQDVGGLVRWALSPENLAVLAPLAGEMDAASINVFADALKKVPAKGIAILVGTDDPKAKAGSIQVAAAFPPELQPQLDLVASGKASPDDLSLLLLGSKSDESPLGGFLSQVEPMDGMIKVNGEVFLGAKDNLLLAAFTPEDLKGSLAALGDSGKRLSMKRRFKAGDFVSLHLDPDLVDAIGKARASEGGDVTWTEEDSKALRETFRAPLDLEVAFEGFKDRFLVSVGANVEEAMTKEYLANWEGVNPVSGGRILLLGEGSPLVAGGGYLSSRALDSTPRLKALWDDAVAELKEIGITEAEAKDLMNGDFSLLVGGNISLKGLIGVDTKLPGILVTLPRSNGAAAAFLKKLEASEAVPVNPVKADGWDQMLQADATSIPLPFFMGVKGEALTLGLCDPVSLAKAPAPGAALAELLKKDSMGTFFIDFEGIRAFLADEKNGVAAALSLYDEGVAKRFKGALDVQLSIPSLSVWAPTVDTSFLEFRLAEVDPAKGLWAKAVELYRSSQRLSPLEQMSMARQVAAQAFKEPNASTNAAEALKPKLGDAAVVQQENKIYVGTLAGDSREELQQAAEDQGLLGSPSLEILPDDKPYAGQEAVWIALEIPQGSSQK